MKKTVRKLAFMLMVCIIFTSTTFNAYATQLQHFNNETLYTEEGMGFTLERVLYENNLTVYAKAFDGTILSIAVRDEKGNVYVDGELVGNSSINIQQNVPLEFNNESSLYSSAAVTWGPWQTSYLNYDTGGKGAAVIAVGLGALCPWIALTSIIAMAGFLAYEYEYVTIRINIQYGDDGELLYYQRYTAFFGNGSYNLGEFRDTGKTAL